MTKCCSSKLWWIRSTSIKSINSTFHFYLECSFNGAGAAGGVVMNSNRRRAGRAQRRVSRVLFLGAPVIFSGEMLALLPVREGGVQVGLKPWAQITIKARLETNQDSNPQSVLLDLSPNIKSESELFNKRNVRNNEELNGCAIPSDIVYRYIYI